MTRSLPLLLLPIGLAFVVACGGSSTVESLPDQGSHAGDGARINPETGEPDYFPLEIILLHDTSIPLNILIQDEFQIHAKVIDYENGVPASDLEVGFELLAGEGPVGDANLAAKAAFTNELGEVENTLRAGYIGDVAYTVRLFAEGAEDRLLEVIVSDSPKGSIAVHLAYEGPLILNTFQIRLMPKSFICGQFQPTSNPSGSLADKTVLDISNVPVFDGLAGGGHFTVLGTARSPTGALAAAGCKDGVFVVANQETPATLDLHLLPLNPTGSYDVDNYFDFTNTLGDLGTVGSVIEGIVTLFNDPGSFLVEQIKTLVKQFLGELITDVAFGLFEDELGSVITSWVLNDSPDWVQDFFTVGDDLTQIVDNLHLISELKVSKLHNNYYFQGIQYWKGVVLTWKLGCEPDAPPECGVKTYSLEELANTQFPQDIIEGSFTGTVVNYNQLFIDQHTIQVSYGKLILFVLNEILLKSLTGENTMKDAVLAFIDCPGIADSFSNSVLDAIGLPEEKLASFCESTVGFLVAPLEAYIANLALDSQLRLSGQCTLADLDDDLYVDELQDGTYTGMVEIDAGAGPPFSGTFSGMKVPLPGPTP